MFSVLDIYIAIYSALQLNNNNNKINLKKPHRITIATEASMCYIFNLWDTQTLSKKTCRRKNVNLRVFLLFEGSILFLIFLPVFSAAFVREVALFSLHCYTCISGRGWVQDTAGMRSLPRHFGNCQECAANGGLWGHYDIFFCYTGMNSTGERTWGTHL